MIDVRAVRVRTAETIAHPAVKALIMRAVVATRYPGTTAQAFYDEIAEGITSDTLGVFVGFNEAREPVALVIGSLPFNAIMMAPQVHLVYSTSRELSRLLGEKLRAWVTKHEHDRLIGVNLWHDDEAFCRVFRHMGETRVIGSLVEASL